MSDSATATPLQQRVAELGGCFSTQPRVWTKDAARAANTAAATSKSGKIWASRPVAKQEKTTRGEHTNERP